MQAAKAGEAVTYIPSLTPEQRRFYWADTTDRDGKYLEITVPASYVEQIRTFTSAPLPQSATPIAAFSRRAASQLSDKWHFTTEIIESPHRMTIVFRENDGDHRIMVTSWDFAAQGAKITVVEEFLNLKVHGLRGTLAFTRSADVPQRGLWKATWIDGVRQYELYVEDGYDASGAPLRTPETIAALAAMLSPSATIPSSDARP